ncbi:MAG: phosphoribosylamine--glycine ligase, partial [Armatimonadetes bacterium]|nr:phosphoribosylamine--glycine ligase [Armatimonadota bacterium]
MRALVVGSGGREHALAWKIAPSAGCDRLFAAPGNAGIAEVAECLPVSATDVPALVRAAQDVAADLVVVGPEAPLAAGLVDALTEAGILAFGPTQAAAQIEASKSYAKELMCQAGVPTARFARFTELGSAHAYLTRLAAAGVADAVVKADGLAAGKGAIVCDTLAAARA